MAARTQRAGAGEAQAWWHRSRRAWLGRRLAIAATMLAFALVATPALAGPGA